MATATINTHVSPAAKAASRTLWLGVACCLATTVLGGVQPVITRWGALNLDPLLFVTGSAVIASLCLLPFLYFKGELGLLVDRRFAMPLFGIGVIGSAATSLSVIYGFKQLSAITGVLLLQTEPVYSLILATVVVGERPTIRQVAATVIVIAGIIYVFGGGSGWSSGASFGFGAILLLSTPLFWQTSHVISLRVMPPLSTLCVTGGRYVFATVVLCAIFVATAHTGSLKQLSDPRALAAIGVSGVFIYCVSSLTWYGAISRLSLAWTTALVVPGVPLLSILFAIAFLGEHASARQLIGIGIAICGVMLLVLGARPHRDAAEAIHEPMT